MKPVQCPFPVLLFPFRPLWPLVAPTGAICDKRNVTNTFGIPFFSPPCHDTTHHVPRRLDVRISEPSMIRFQLCCDMSWPASSSVNCLVYLERTVDNNVRASFTVVTDLWCSSILQWLSCVQEWIKSSSKARVIWKWALFPAILSIVFFSNLDIRKKHIGKKDQNKSFTFYTDRSHIVLYCVVVWSRDLTFPGLTDRRPKLLWCRVKGAASWRG